MTSDKPQTWQWMLWYAL